MKKMLTRYFVSLLLSLLLCAHCSVAVAQKAQPSENFVKIPITQWEMLKQSQQSLELKLYDLSVQAENLKNPSDTLLVELTEAEKQLQQSRLELRELDTRLQIVKDLHERTQKSLSLLTTQIEDERKKQKAIMRRMKIQQGLWFVLGGVIGVALT